MELGDESMNDTLDAQQQEMPAAAVALYPNRRESASLFLFHKEPSEGEETEEDVEARERDRVVNQQKCGRHACSLYVCVILTVPLCCDCCAGMSLEPRSWRMPSSSVAWTRTKTVRYNALANENWY